MHGKGYALATPTNKLKILNEIVSRCFISCRGATAEDNVLAEDQRLQALFILRFRSWHLSVIVCNLRRNANWDVKNGGFDKNDSGYCWLYHERQKQNSTILQNAVIYGDIIMIQSKRCVFNCDKNLRSTYERKFGKLGFGLRIKFQANKQKYRIVLPSFWLSTSSFSIYMRWCKAEIVTI